MTANKEIEVEALPISKPTKKEDTKNQVLLYLTKKYSYKSPSNIITCQNVNEAIDVVKKSELPILEVLKEDLVKLFFDIEKIPENRTDIITKIINDLNKDYGLTKDGYVLTENRNSVHKGLSYHLIYPYKTYKRINSKLITHFTKVHPEYRDYIDNIIYTRNRLFRCPGSTRPSSADPNDKHTLVRGSLEDSFIQNVNAPKVQKLSDIIPKEKLTEIFNTETDYECCKNSVCGDNMLISPQKATTHMLEKKAIGQLLVGNIKSKSITAKPKSFFGFGVWSPPDQKCKVAKTGFNQCTAKIFSKVSPQINTSAWTHDIIKNGIHSSIPVTKANGFGCNHPTQSTQWNPMNSNNWSLFNPVKKYGWKPITGFKAVNQPCKIQITNSNYHSGSQQVKDNVRCGIHSQTKKTPKWNTQPVWNMPQKSVYQPQPALPIEGKMDTKTTLALLTLIGTLNTTVCNNKIKGDTITRILRQASVEDAILYLNDLIRMI